jgi:Prolyl oligopeptidase family
MRSLSPITYAANVKTPALFLHGESDMRVPIEEAEQMYTALKKHHVAAKFIRYPGNYHGNWPAWDMVHRYYNEALWFRQLCLSETQCGAKFLRTREGERTKSPEVCQYRRDTGFTVRPSVAIGGLKGGETSVAAHIFRVNNQCPRRFQAARRS